MKAIFIGSDTYRWIELVAGEDEAVCAYFQTFNSLSLSSLTSNMLNTYFIRFLGSNYHTKEPTLNIKLLLIFLVQVSMNSTKLSISHFAFNKIPQLKTTIMKVT